MDYRDQIRKLTETHRVLDEQVKHLEMKPFCKCNNVLEISYKN